MPEHRPPLFVAIGRSSGVHERGVHQGGHCTATGAPGGAASRTGG